MDPLDFYKRLESKVDSLSEDMGEVKGDLKYHIKRTALAEEGIAQTREKLEVLKKEIEPLKNHVAMWAGAGKLLAVVVALGGLLLGVWKAFA